MTSTVDAQVYNLFQISYKILFFLIIENREIFNIISITALLRLAICWRFISHEGKLMLNGKMLDDNI